MNTDLIALVLRAEFYSKQTLLYLLCLLIPSPEFKRIASRPAQKPENSFLWLTQVAVSNEIVQGGIYSSVTQTERGVLGGRTSSRQSGAGPGQTRGDKSREGERPLPLVSLPPKGRKEDRGCSPDRSEDVLFCFFLCAPSSCRKQHHAGHQSLGKHWTFGVLSADVAAQWCMSQKVTCDESEILMRDHKWFERSFRLWHKRYLGECSHS